MKVLVKWMGLGLMGAALSPMALADGSAGGDEKKGTSLGYGPSLEEIKPLDSGLWSKAKVGDCDELSKIEDEYLYGVNRVGNFAPGDKHRVVTRVGRVYAISLSDKQFDELDGKSLLIKEAKRRTEVTFGFQSLGSMAATIKIPGEWNSGDTSSGSDEIALFTPSGAFPDDKSVKFQFKGKKCFLVKTNYPHGVVSVYKDGGEGEPSAPLASAVTGEAEHVYLTADVLFRTAKKNGFSSSGGQPSLKSTPSNFYVGVNYKVGDVFVDYGSSRWMSDFSLKLLAQASKRPGDSYGWGVGYRTDYAEIFLGRLRTKGDISATGETGRSHLSTVAGVSFSIGQGATWIKSLYATEPAASSK